ncbi:hypothetical protein B0T17DRAFT_512881 [Bombardia bombarda]|uniref:Rhodopsin domain-containing protein n=1 Tax=Bombardia bombarda TaxID=252184 RepID=A0AA39XI13_9PEZI|nr:hypothetical protein B0T17DRAFT_512881 [Bombardia bombarda]
MNRGIQLAVAMWAMTAFSLLLVALRLYTRIRIVRFVGIEDHLFAWTGIFLLVFTATIQVAVHYGLGRSFWTLAVDDSSNAIFWTYVANTFAITGNAMAKLSMGFFLLRVVQIRWQKRLLWLLIVVTAGTSIALVIMLWNQTTPVRASWDPLRTPGQWNIQIQPMSVGLGAWSSACDFFFAIFPWVVIWHLRMSRREKVMLAGGMSLGVIAGACGITRTVVLSQIDVMDYTLNFAPYFIWAGAEIAVAMVCLGIPTLRPLYLRRRGTSIGYADRVHTRLDACNDDDQQLPQFSEKKPIDLPQNIQQTPPNFSPQVYNLNPIDHKIHELRDPTPQETPNYLRDSASSHTMVESSPSPEFHPTTTMCRPPSAHVKRGRSDSVDAILGLYDERSHSKGRAITADKNYNYDYATANTAVGAPDGIWVKNEIWIKRITAADWPLRG